MRGLAMGRFVFAGLLIACLAQRVSGAGLSSEGSQLWRDVTIENNDEWGSVVATGDFNGDGKMDLAVGCPGESIDGKDFAGAVRVIYGTASGLASAGGMYITQAAFGFNETEERDKFGAALAAGDFDNDTYDDLAIGVPEEDVGAVINAGAVCVIYGSASGLNGFETQMFIQDSVWIHGSSEAHDYFGMSLAVGDFNRDNYADLAMGAPREDIGTKVDAGEVHILYGAPTVGLSTNRHAADDWDQDVSGVPGGAEAGDYFGYSLVAGSFNNDGYVDDLAIGVPLEDVGSVTNAGAVNVLYGSSGGLTTAGALVFDRNTGVIPGDATKDDRFGAALASGREPGSGTPRSFLAVGCPGADWTSSSTTYTNIGAILVLLGKTAGISTSQYQWHQWSLESSAPIGESMVIADLDGDPYLDMVAGCPRFDVDGDRDAGRIVVGYGRAAGFFQGRRESWDLDVSGVSGLGAPFNAFGFAVAAGDFNDDNLADVAIGVPGYATQSGAVSVLYSMAGLWSSATDEGGGWRHLPWFGYFNVNDAPWIYHMQLGWMYPVGDTTADLWLYSLDLGWLYTTDGLYPWMYSLNLGSWMYYLVDSVTPRWFYNVNAAEWQAY